MKCDKCNDTGYVRKPLRHGYTGPMEPFPDGFFPPQYFEKCECQVDGEEAKGDDNAE